MQVEALETLAGRMERAIKAYQSELASLRGGRASPALLENLRVEAYGQAMRVSQLASVSCPEPRVLVVSLWDQSLSFAVEKAISEAGLGLNPQREGGVIRVRLPDLSEEMRREVSKVARQKAEAARVSIRNLRRDYLDGLKKGEKNKEISQDDVRRRTAEVQERTDAAVKSIDAFLKRKEDEIMTI